MKNDDNVWNYVLTFQFLRWVLFEHHGTFPPDSHRCEWQPPTPSQGVHRLVLLPSPQCHPESRLWGHRWWPAVVLEASVHICPWQRKLTKWLGSFQNQWWVLKCTGRKINDGWRSNVPSPPLLALQLNTKFSSCSKKAGHALDTTQGKSSKIQALWEGKLDTMHILVGVHE